MTTLRFEYNRTSSMSSVRIPYWRAAAALLCAVVLFVVSAAAPIHGHADSSQHACTLCQFDNSPADIDASGPLVSPPTAIVTAVIVAADAPDAPVLRAEQGRAPPSIA